MITIRPVTPADHDAWFHMRAALWPHCPPDDHRREMAEQVADPARYAVFVAEAPDGRLVGMLEASLRPFVEDCVTSPVGYIEGWYVAPEARRQGVGAALVRAAEDWARLQGCTEMASDTEIENAISQEAHRRLGYEVTGRIVHFRKPLYPPE